MLEKGQKIMLDLGEMNDIAEVRSQWEKVQEYFGIRHIRLILPDCLMQVKTNWKYVVTNNWANRLIGDEQEPADFEWGKDRGEKMGRAMLAYPDWFVKNQPRPSQGRKTFSIWYYYRKDSPLKPAGLVGPVRLVIESEVKL